MWMVPDTEPNSKSFPFRSIELLKQDLPPAVSIYREIEKSACILVLNLLEHDVMGVLMHSQK